MKVETVISCCITILIHHAYKLIQHALYADIIYREVQLEEVCAECLGKHCILLNIHQCSRVLPRPPFVSIPYRCHLGKLYYLVKKA